MEEIIQNLSNTELIIMLVLGIVVMLVGYRIKKVAFFVAWFLLGFIGTTYLMPQISNLWPEIGNSQLYQTLITIGGGLIVAMMGFSIEKLCVAGICFALTILVSIQFFGNGVETIGISAVVGLAIGSAAVVLMKPATIVATSGVGAYATTIALIMSVSGITQNEFYWPMLLGFTAVGSTIQFLTTRNMS